MLIHSLFHSLIGVKCNTNFSSLHILFCIILYEIETYSMKPKFSSTRKDRFKIKPVLEFYRYFYFKFFNLCNNVGCE